MTVDVDVFRSDAIGNLTAHLSGPLAAGARRRRISLDANGAGVIDGGARHPLLLVTLSVDLGADARELDVVVGGAAAVRLRFAPYTERGAALAVPILAASAPTAITVAPHVDIEVRLLEGVLGRLLFALSAEKARLRRTAREVSAGRMLAAARGEALDRLGVELRVARFRAQLAWSEEQEELIATPGVEGDLAYRSRLTLYRPQVQPTRARFEAALPELMARVGYQGSFAITEPDTELAIAMRVVSPPDDARRLDYLSYVRRQFLLPIDATVLPAERLVSVAERARVQQLLARLKTRTTWPAGAHVAPAIAAGLERVARCAAALGVPGPLQITRAQRDDGGSRYELGIGADVTAFTAAVAQSMTNALRAGALAGNPDPETRQLLAAMTPEDATIDAAAQWLFRGCGLRTAHLVTGGTLFVSHLPIHGASLGVTAASAGLELTAVLRPQGTSALDANLDNTLTAALQNQTDWVNALIAALLAAAMPPAPARALFTAENLAIPPTQAELTAAIAALTALPAELFVILRGSTAISSAILAGNAAGATALRTIVARLRAGGAVSILPVVAGTAVFLVVGAIDLPGNATVSNRRRAQFRWLAAPLEADGRIGSLERAQGARNRYAFAGPANASQVAAIIAMTPTRPVPRSLHRRVEPYTVEIDLADDAQPLLSFAQYEYLMNLLDRWCPLGVTIDTTRLRTLRVDVTGDGTPDLTSLRLQHTFRPFRGRHPFGARS